MRLSRLRLPAAAVAALLSASLVACSSDDSAARQSNSSEQSRVTVQNCGRDVTVERPIERAIAGKSTCSRDAVRAGSAGPDGRVRHER